MVALTSGRNTPKRDGRDFGRAVAASTKIYQGALVCLNASGYAVPGSTSTTLVVDGVAKADADNSAGAAGAITVETEKGVFRFANSTSADAITIAEIGDNCYIVDDQTVAKTSGSSTRSVAGTIVDVDANGVWVRI